MEKFTNGIGAALTNSPFNSHFYTKLCVACRVDLDVTDVPMFSFELLLRIKANIMWPGSY